MIFTHVYTESMPMSASSKEPGSKSQDHRLQGHPGRTSELFWQSGSQVRLTQGALKITDNLSCSRQSCKAHVTDTSFQTSRPRTTAAGSCDSSMIAWLGFQLQGVLFLPHCPITESREPGLQLHFALGKKALCR